MAGIMLSYGMPYELYWYGEMEAIYSYYEKMKYEQDKEANDLDTSAWLFGSYMAEAIASCFSKTYSYPKEPRVVKEKRMTEEMKIINQYNYLRSWSSQVIIPKIEEDVEQ